MEMIKEFFGFEGYMSFEHLSFVTFLMIVMVMLAIYFGRRYANKDLKEKNKVLLIAAILIDPFGWLILQMYYLIIIICF